MKKIIIIIIILLTTLLTIDSIKYLTNYNSMVKQTEIYKEQGYDIESPKHMDVFSKQGDYYRNGCTIIIQFIYPLILIILGTYTFHTKIHSGFFKNIIARQKYDKFINKEIINSWKWATFIPCFVIVIFILSCFVTNFNFIISNNTDMYSNGIAVSIFKKMFDNIAMIINLFIVSISCINIGLIFTKKNNNFILSSVISYLFIIMYQIIVSVIIGPILSNVFNSDFFANGLTLFSFWYYDTGVTCYNMFAYATLLFLITTIILKNRFKNKESVIINAEK